MTSLKRFLKTALTIMVVLGVTLIIITGLLTLITGRKLEAKIASLKASGQPVSYADLETDIPDSQNAAVILQKAFDEMKIVEKSQIAGQSPYTILGTIPNAGAKAEDPAIWEHAKQALELNDEVIRLVTEASALDICQFPSSDEAEKMFPIFAKHREITRILRANAIVSAREGRMDDAVKSLNTAFRLQDQSRPNANLISCLTSIAMTGISSDALKNVVQYGTLPENQAKLLYDTLSSMDFEERYNEALQGERVTALNLYQSMQEYRFRPMRYADQIAYLDLIDQRMKLSDITYREASKCGLAGKAAGNVPFYAILTKTVVPVFDRSMLARDKGLTEVEGSRIFVALEAYRVRFGRYPASLNELRNKLKWEISVDPFSGKDFVYRQNGKGFILYSIGYDMKDNGGKTRDELKGKSGSEDRGDLVWKR